jgi:hypothetical protein
MMYQLYDNNCFMACNEEAVRSPPGRLVMTDRDEFRELFTSTFPLLRAGRDSTKILLSPIIRYVLQPCGADSKHVVGRREPNSCKSLWKFLGNIAEWLRGLAFTRHIRNFAVVSLVSKVLGQSDAVFFKKDPVQEDYKTLDKRLLSWYSQTKNIL